jgi:5-carboxymethyl-2-hydroxymuconate isomerase
MPHAIIEFSDLAGIGVEGAALLDAVFDGMQASGLFGTEDIKVRAHPVSMTRNGSDNFSFIHVQLRILSGRTVEQKTGLSEQVRANICALPGQARSTSVEVVDIDRAVYAKTVV